MSAINNRISKIEREVTSDDGEVEVIIVSREKYSDAEWEEMKARGELITVQVNTNKEVKNVY